MTAPQPTPPTAKRGDVWRPIELAPKDTLVDIWIEGTCGGTCWCDCYYDEISDQWRTSRPGGRLGNIQTKYVTHFKIPPLAPRPEVGLAQEFESRLKQTKQFGSNACMAAQREADAVIADKREQCAAPTGDLWAGISAIAAIQIDDSQDDAWDAVGASVKVGVVRAARRALSMKPPAAIEAASKELS